MELNQDFATAIKAALKAGESIMKVYDSDFEVEFKEDKSPLTIADKNANDIISTFLQPTNIPIISEENKQIEYDVRRQWEACWVVDPVDGTKEFIKRNGEFTVNIALVIEGYPKMGVIYAPATKTLYAADVRKEVAFKAVLLDHNSSIDEVINASEPLKPSDNEAITRVVGSRSHMNKETSDYIDTLNKKGKKTEIVSKGSSLKFCIIAEGGADVYPRFAPTMEWDTAAGQAICKAVAVDVISLETKEPLLYNKKNLLNPWFIVSKTKDASP